MGSQITNSITMKSMIQYKSEQINMEWISTTDSTM